MPEVVKIEVRGTVRANFKVVVEIDLDEYEKLKVNGKLNDHIEDEAFMLVDDGGVDLNPDVGDLEVFSTKVLDEVPNV